MNNKSDSLGDRMKRYEDVTRYHVLRRTPVIIRVDGRAFHTFTKCLKYYDSTLKNTPFSIVMHNVMTATAYQLVKQIQNAQFAYTQSDEISILLRDWDKHETEQWFDGGIQKMASISAAIASTTFNWAFSNIRKLRNEDIWANELAHFDARVFNIPKEEVTNYFIWRQQDATRNSIQMLGRHYFSQKQMYGKNNSQIQDMLMTEHNINWNDIPTWMKRGSCVHRTIHVYDTKIQNNMIFSNDEIPVFTQDRDFIERHLQVPEISELQESLNNNAPIT